MLLNEASRTALSFAVSCMLFIEGNDLFVFSVLLEKHWVSNIFLIDSFHFIISSII